MLAGIHPPSICGTSLGGTSCVKLRNQGKRQWYTCHLEFDIYQTKNKRGKFTFEWDKRQEDCSDLNYFSTRRLTVCYPPPCMWTAYYRNAVNRLVGIKFKHYCYTQDSQIIKEDRRIVKIASIWVTRLLYPALQQEPGTCVAESRLTGVLNVLHVLL